MSDNKHHRRSVLKIGGASAVSALLAGCTGGQNGGDGDSATTNGTGSSNGGGEITYLNDRTGAKEIIEDIASDFESEYPEYSVNIVTVEKGVGGTNAQLQRMKASGNPPDVVWHAIGSTYNYLLEDNLVPMTDVISDLDVPDLMRANNESYFLPIVLEPSMAWYRSDYYDQPPTTQQEALNQAEQITENNAINGFITQSGETNNAQVQTIQHLWQNGVDIYDGATGDIEVTIDQGENQQNAVRAFSWLKDISQYSPNANGWEWGDAVNALQTDSAASHMSISLDPLLIQANRPDLLDSLTAAPYPKPQGVNAEKWFAYYEGNVVRSDGSTTEGAKLFAEFFSRSPKTMDFVLSQPLFQVPPTREGLNSDRFQNNDLISQFPEAVEIIDNNWDKWRPSFLTADEAKPNAVAAQSQVERVMGQAAAELLVNDRSPEDTVSWVAETLRGL